MTCLPLPINVYHSNKRCNCICGAHNFIQKNNTKENYKFIRLKIKIANSFVESIHSVFVCVFGVCSLDARSFVCCCRFTFPSWFAATLIFPLLSTCKHTTESCNAHLCQPLRRCLFVILLSHALLFYRICFFSFEVFAAIVCVWSFSHSMTLCQSGQVEQSAVCFTTVSNQIVICATCYSVLNEHKSL